MNILFFLIPKVNVEYIYDDFSLRQAIEKMQFHHYSTIPVLSRSGKFVNTLSDSDILWELKNNDLDLEKCEEFPIINIKHKRITKAITIDKPMEALVDLISEQNFVPVIDDQKNFIGIITRKAVIKYLSKEIKKK
ncbi:MAG: CBS domain-containing protein [Bacilli bacterium]|nr:CBS domain-containing protein [Bacilli bacterium]